MAEKKFYVGIKGVVIKDDKVLLIRASKDVEGRTHWEVPGGRIDSDESIEQALRRELSEEVPNIKNVAVHEAVHAHRVPHDIGEDISLVLIFYRVTADFDEEVELSNEHEEARWVSEKEAMELAHPTVAAAVKHAFAMQSS